MPEELAHLVGDGGERRRSRELDYAATGTMNYFQNLIIFFLSHMLHDAHSFAVRPIDLINYPEKRRESCVTATPELWSWNVVQNAKCVPGKRLFFRSACHPENSRHVVEFFRFHPHRL